uniref:60S acidic ribosomal protein P2 n=1 Tax=Arcella intermedia TaxID=1963864 RepID=A0A6B2LTA0_9EUKA
MRHVAAYLLAVLGGNHNPSADDIKNILDSVGVEAETEKVDKLLNELSGKTLAEVLAAGRAKISSVPSGGSGGARAAAPSGGAAAAPAGGAKEEKKEEEKKEATEEDEGLGFDLFG